MDNFNDEYGILEEFNAVCGLIAANLKSYISAHSEMGDETSAVEIPLNEINIPDIEDWWLLMDRQQNFFELYTLKMQELKDYSVEDYTNHFHAGMDALRGYLDLWKEYKDIDSDTTLKAMRYLPHRTRYAYDALLKLNGFRILNDLCADLGNVGLDVALHPREEAGGLHQFNAYMLSLVIQTGDGEPLMKRFDQRSKPRLH